MLIVRSPVRISFGGGGTDLPAYYEQFGGAVLSAAINKYFYTVLTRRDDGRIQVISADLRAIETWENFASLSARDKRLQLPIAALKETGPGLTVNLFLASEIPPGTGLGSSASVTVNLLKALTTYQQQPLSRYELAERAFFIARQVLGKSVGKQDEYAAAFGGLNYIEFFGSDTVKVTPVELSSSTLRELQSNLMLYFTGSAHDSWAILEEQERSTRDSTSSAAGALHEIRKLADDMRDALVEGDLRSFGRMLDQGWRAKKRVSEKISTSRIDHLYELALAHGAIGGKITGAGGGGFLLLYCEPEARPNVRAAFQAEGLREMNFEFDFNGAHVVANDPFLDGDERCGLRWEFQPVEAWK